MTNDLKTRENSSHIFHQIAADRADTGLIIQTMQGVVLWANQAYYDTMKLHPKDVIGKHPLNFAFAEKDKFGPEEIANFRFDPHNIEDETNVVRKNVRGDGKTVLLHLTLSFFPDADNAKYAVLVAREVTKEVARERELHRTNAKLKHIAAHDNLTDVANRSSLNLLLEKKLAETPANGSQIGVMHIDVDRFKEINDTHGHTAGDAVLKEIATRLRKNVRKADFVARVGGDEFVVVCTNIRELSGLQKISDGLIAAMDEPIACNEINLICGISIGVALTNERVKTVEDILVQSDFALYDAKKTGRGRVALYNQNLHEKYSFETQLSADLKSAIKNKTISFHFQPILGSLDREVQALETLVRWKHPKYGMLPPSAFLPIAQHVGVMADIDFLAIEAALDLKLQLNASGHQSVQVTINASPELLIHAEFLERLINALDSRGLDRGSILIEVLETVVLRNQDDDSSYFAVLEGLSKAGIDVVLDDFGSGNAGLAQLSKLKVKGLKTDISLIENLLADRATELVFTALVNLCHDLGLHVTAEGVESEELAGRVAAIGAEAMQGYCFTHPLPEADILTWLAANSAPKTIQNTASSKRRQRPLAERTTDQASASFKSTN